MRTTFAKKPLKCRVFVLFCRYNLNFEQVISLLRFLFNSNNSTADQFNTCAHFVDLRASNTQPKCDANIALLFSDHMVDTMFIISVAFTFVCIISRIIGLKACIWWDIKVHGTRYLLLYSWWSWRYIRKPNTKHVCIHRNSTYLIGPDS